MKPTNKPEIEILRLSGNKIIPYIGNLADLRIRVFREFPYLYVGSTDYEEKYIQRYTTSDESVIVIAKVGDNVIGASTGMPLKDEDKMVYGPFKKNGMDWQSYFYFGESVLRSEFRGQGIGVRFFEEREKHAISHGYKCTTFCAVDRPENHPRRPANYKPLDPFWEKRGYKKKSELKTTFKWKDLDDSEESPKSLTFWIKEHLSPSSLSQ
jgi:GNAT superfamily N-acetyltransferase